MKWITRSHVHVDRVACPWLITRFVDNEAEFLFIPASQIRKVADDTDAIPFDAPDVELGHHDGRCSFESIILKYELKDPALLRTGEDCTFCRCGSQILIRTRLREGSKRLRSVTAYVTRMMRRTSCISLKFMMLFMPGAGYRWQRDRLSNNSI